MSQENNFVPQQKEYKKLRPFPLFMKNNFPFIENTFEALDYYGLLSEVVKFLNDVIANEHIVMDNQQAVYDAFIELNSYVSNYFDNLDVQEEINNKLDDMAEQGTLQEIISAYLNSIAVFGFDTLSDLKNASNLINGSYGKTMGYYSINDGGGCLYKITNDITNELFYETMTADNLYAVPIFENYHVIEVDKLGMKKSDTTTTESEKATFNTTLLNNIITKIDTTPDYIIKFSNSLYQFNNNIKFTKSIRLIGTLDNTDVDVEDSYYAGTTLLDVSSGNAPFIKYEPEDYENTPTSRLWGIIIENIKFIGKNQAHDGLIIRNSGHVTRLSNVTIMKFSGYGLFLDNNNDSFINNLNIIECGIETNDLTKYALNITSSLESYTSSNALHFFGLHLEHVRYAINIDYATQVFFESTKIEVGQYRTHTTFIESSEKPVVNITKNAYQINFNDATFNAQGYNATTEKYYFMNIAQVDNFNVRTRTLTNCNFTTGSNNGGNFIHVLNSNTVLNACSFTNISPLVDSIKLEGETTRLTNSSLNLINIGTSSLTTVYVICLVSAIIDNCSITSTNSTGALVTALKCSGSPTIGHLSGFIGIKYFSNSIANPNITEEYNLAITSDNIGNYGDFDNNDFFTFDFLKFQRPFKNIVISSLPRNLKIKDFSHFPNGYKMNVTNNQATYTVSLTQYGTLKLPNSVSSITLNGAGTYFEYNKSMSYGFVNVYNDLS